jgi:AcrR family transcriptional regulator
MQGRAPWPGLRHDARIMARTARSSSPSPGTTVKRKRPVAGPPADLREACVAAAHAVIAEEGIEQLSLRDVARRLNVSHQAPYKHYPSRDHLLAEVVRRCFVRFGEHLDRRPRFDDPHRDLESLGLEYLRFALANPLEYRLMFSTPWPKGAEHDALERDARYAFDILRAAIGVVHGAKAVKSGLADRDAMFVWSSMHGLAGVLQSNIMPTLALKPGVLEDAVTHIMCRVGDALATTR